MLNQGDVQGDVSDEGNDDEQERRDFRAECGFQLVRMDTYRQHRDGEQPLCRIRHSFDT